MLLRAVVAERAAPMMRKFGLVAESFMGRTAVGYVAFV